MRLDQGSSLGTRMVIAQHWPVYGDLSAQSPLSAPVIHVTWP